MSTKKFQLRMFRKLIFLALVVSIRGDENIEKPVAEGRVTVEPVSVEPVEPVPAKPVTVEPVEPVPAKPVTVEPVEPVPAKPVTVEPVTVEPVAEGHVAAEPVYIGPVFMGPMPKKNVSKVLISEGTFTEDEEDEDEAKYKDPNSNPHLPPPPLKPGEPVKVNVSAIVFEYALDTDKQQIEVGMIFRQEWNDVRLSYNRDEPTRVLRIEQQRTFWTPDLFFANEMSTFRVTFVEPNGYIRIFPNGDILMSRRAYVKTRCAMDLKAYPYDIQKCELLIESYSYSTSEMALRWNKSDEVINFKSGRSEEFSAELFYRSTVMEFKDAQYETFVIEFKLKRVPYTILFRIILPISLYLMLSWSSFFFKPTNHNFRMMLSVLPLIAFLLQINFSRSFFVLVGYPTGLDMWTYFSFLLMNSAFFEFVYVFWTAERQKAANIKMGTNEEEYNNSVDYAARILFLVGSAVFNFVCWLYIYYNRL